LDQLKFLGTLSRSTASRICKLDIQYFQKKQYTDSQAWKNHKTHTIQIRGRPSTDQARIVGNLRHQQLLQSPFLQRLHVLVASSAFGGLPASSQQQQLEALAATQRAALGQQQH
jgi:hypothetical protein